MLITRVRPSIFLPAAAFIWSAISTLTVLCTSAGSLWGVQFVLGIVEAPLFPGTPEKRAAGRAIVNIFSYLGNVILPYFFPDRDQPRYTMAMILQIVFASLGITLASIIKWHLTRKNKKMKVEADCLGVEFNPFTT
ncbi:hypothetical protein FBEOM_8657 [Fusarium beomiforme]|uniref:Major facilitator superfamily (MFS) profile domain-containing protein n=1 Tax=Fusarium beomiforme TaxID=44412 RepID=A0A9P5AGE4_9HYPO|nr:hypothetical protein FBEOM_8657 [Fusarium beomiforme]